MRIKIIAILTIMLFLSLSTVTATKIQKDDTWTYEDRDNKQYNETAIEIVQLSLVDSISMVKLKTDRGFPFDLNFALDKFESNLVFNYDYIYITQEGAIPYITYDGNVSGTITYNETVFNIKNVEGWWFYVGDPSISLVTTSSIKYEMSYMFEFNDTENITFYTYWVWKEFVMSSNNNAEDKIKNFTITPSRQEYTFRMNDSVNLIDTTTSKLDLQSSEIAMSLTYEEGISQPTYIAQTEPVKISNGLGLSQIGNKFVEYFLVRNDVSTEDEEPFYFVWILPLVIMVVLRYNSPKL